MDWSSLSFLDWLIFIGIAILMLLPWIVAAVKIKQRVKVGKIDTEGIAMPILIFLVPATMLFWGVIPVPLTLIYICIAGFVLFGVIFNHLPGAGKLTEIWQLDLDHRNVYRKQYYTYESGGYTCIVDINIEEEREESIIDLFKRLWGKVHLLIPVKENYSFRINKKHDLFICEDIITWNKYPIWYQGEERELKITFFIPVATGELNPMEFVTKFVTWKESRQRIAALLKQVNELEMDVHFLAKEESREQLQAFNEVYFRKKERDIDARLAGYDKVNLKVPYESRAEWDIDAIFKRTPKPGKGKTREEITEEELSTIEISDLKKIAKEAVQQNESK